MWFAAAIAVGMVVIIMGSRGMVDERIDRIKAQSQQRREQRNQKRLQAPKRGRGEDF